MKSGRGPGSVVKRTCKGSASGLRIKQRLVGVMQAQLSCTGS